MAPVRLGLGHLVRPEPPWGRIEAVIAEAGEYSTGIGEIFEPGTRVRDVVGMSFAVPRCRKRV